MHDAAGEAAPCLAQDLCHGVVSVALVQEHRQAQLGSQPNLCVQPVDLRRSWREIAKEVEPTLADGDDLGLRRELP